MLKRQSRPRGVAIVTALLVLLVTTVIVFAIASVGIHNLNLTRADLRSKRALYAAESGAQAALYELNKNHDWKTGFTKTSFGSQPGTSYQVSVTDNFSGTTALTAPNGATVPAGTKYILATGTTTEGGTQTRQVGFLIRKNVQGGFNWAVASGNNVQFKAGADIHGGVKSSGDISFEAKADVIPVNGEGRVLGSGKVQVKSGLGMDSAQDVRARGDIVNSDKIKGTTSIHAKDTTDDTLPFIADGRIKNELNSGEEGEVLPNPDVSKLLSPGNYVDHGSTTTINSTFDLGGKIHYFPNGITFKGKITGEGTVVVGNGNTANFETSLGSGSEYLAMNVIAIDGKNGTVGGNSIIFKSSAKIQGLIYSHDDITSNASLDVRGSVISYKPGGGDFVHTGASLDVILEPLKVSVPGFEEWLGGGGSSGKVSVLSWQRN